MSKFYNARLFRRRLFRLSIDAGCWQFLCVLFSIYNITLFPLREDGKATADLTFTGILI